MGYEMGLRKVGARDSGVCLDDVYWTQCGWDKTDLYRAIAGLVDEGVTGDYYAVVRIPVERLDFIRRMGEQVRANPVLEWADRLGSIDESWRYEFVEGLSPEVRAACRMSYVVDGLDAAESEVAAEVARLADYHDMDVVGFGQAIAALQARGVSEVELYGA